MRWWTGAKNEVIDMEFKNSHQHFKHLCIMYVRPLDKVNI